MLLGVDVGGTFTDAVLLDGPRVHTAKVPSTPTEQSDGVLHAIEAVLRAAQVEPRTVTRFAHGMTVATNALLEGKAARAALIATDGFTDILELGRQARVSLYRLCQTPPAALVAPQLRFGAPERMGPDGPLRALEEQDARALIEKLARCEPQAVAVALLHSYAHPEHELALGDLIRERLPNVHVTLSHELVGTFREFERTATTVLDAALSPLLSGYLRRLIDRAQAIGLPEPQVMQSSGGLSDPRQAAEHAALTVLSGPAGGVAGALLLSRMAEEPNVLCFDMGGTSCDVCVIERGEVAESAERLLAGRPLALAALDIHTVGAGGGSIAWRDPGGALRVGPRSAGADPGPACYGLSGTQPTVTDANLILGRLPEDSALAGGLKLARLPAERAIAPLAEELGLSIVRCAEGIVRVAEAQMLAALRLMSVERGLHPRNFALMAFGGAGPLHAGAIARELGIERILCPSHAGVLCALGLAAAAPRRDFARSVMLTGQQLTAERISAERDALLRRARGALGQPTERARVRYELRYQGQSHELAVRLDGLGSDGEVDPRRLRNAFEETHCERYGYSEPEAELQLVTIRVSVWGAGVEPQLRAGSGAPLERETRRVVFDGRELDTDCLRGDPEPGTTVAGPAILELGQSTVLIAPGWSGEVDEYGTIRLRDNR